MLTCYNRKKDTVSCVKSLVEGNRNISFHFIITDDNSSDGTAQALKELPFHITLLSGNGSLFWNGGMEKALGYALEKEEKTDYYMLINDDVRFFPGAVEKLLDRQKKYPEAVIAGATADKEGNTSYGGVKLLSKHFAKFSLLDPTQEYIMCDTFNANCVLMPAEVFFRAGNVDGTYCHSMSDYDYGMHIRKIGFPIYNSAEHIGVCNDNEIAGSWRDASLTRKERLKRKESPKGLPKKDWYYFIRKNYGFFPALYHSITPYLRILLGR